MSRRAKAATLAVGTEITDGQIVDRNSAWISKRLTDAGVEVVEHRAVADDRGEIERALHELVARVDVLFVTGGLGPTSDDFTREVLSTFCGRELVFDDGSWKHIESRFAARGLQAKPIQRQQCFFPKGARIMTNNAGTANAFSFDHSARGRDVRVYALPGPPAEIATVWDEHLVEEIGTLTPESEKEDLHLIRTLGTGESAIAEITEKIIAGHGLKVGYRAHLPYVEVKLWSKRSEKAKAAPVIDAVEKALSQWTVGHGGEDLADALLAPVAGGRKIHVRDHATRGLLEERLLERLRSLKAGDRESKGLLQVTSTLAGRGADVAPAGFDVEIEIREKGAEKAWVLSVKKSGGPARELDVNPTALYNFGTERGRKYLCEAVFQQLASIGL